MLRTCPTRSTTQTSRSGSPAAHRFSSESAVTRSLVAVLGVLTVLSGCSTSTDCRPGEERLCTCGDGVTVGTRRCKADSSGYESCKGCPNPTVCDAGTKRTCSCTDGGSAEQLCK